MSSERYELNKQLAQMLKGGVIMDVTTPEQAQIAEEAGACAVMALERIPADIRAAGGVSRMSDPKMIKGIQEAVSIPVMGLGGITTWQDAIEFIMAGAAVVQIGTGSFMNPALALDVIDGMERYLEEKNIGNISEICGII